MLNVAPPQRVFFDDVSTTTTAIGSEWSPSRKSLYFALSRPRSPLSVLPTRTKRIACRPGPKVSSWPMSRSRVAFLSKFRFNSTNTFPLNTNPVHLTHRSVVVPLSRYSFSMWQSSGTTFCRKARRESRYFGSLSSSPGLQCLMTSTRLGNNPENATSVLVSLTIPPLVVNIWPCLDLVRSV
jgi:hypothetical protein